MWYNGIIKVILKTPLHSLISSGVDGESAQAYLVAQPASG